MGKRLCALMIPLVLLLAACGGKANEAETLVQTLRGKYLEMTACTGHMDLVADYGQRVYTFGVDFSWEREGETVLTLTSPENVAGVTARIARGKTALEYDGVSVETGPLNAAGLTPMDALPALLAYAREGYLAECVLEGETDAQLRVTCREPENDPGQGVEADLWFDADSLCLCRGEISDGGRTVIQCTFTAFVPVWGEE